MLCSLCLLPYVCNTNNNVLKIKKILGGNISTRPLREVRTVRYTYLQKKSCNNVLQPTTVRPIFLLWNILDNLHSVLFRQRNLNKNETNLLPRRFEVKHELQIKDLSPLCFRTALLWFLFIKMLHIIQ
jgi:hypothetical protein